MCGKKNCELSIWRGVGVWVTAVGERESDARKKDYESSVIRGCWGCCGDSSSVRVSGRGRRRWRRKWRRRKGRRRKWRRRWRRRRKRKRV